MTTELVTIFFQEQFNIKLEPADPSYSLDWFRTEIDGFKFQLGVEGGIFKINVDLEFIGYDDPEKESLKFIKEVNKEIGNDKRIYLGEADWYYRLFPKKGVLETIKTGEEIVALVNEFLDFGNHKKIKWMK